jgi:hypothetical protein
MVTAQTVQQIWIATLVIYAVVLVVVAALLTMILLTAKRIHAGVAAIWTVGQKIANNTVHIALLDTTNFLLRDTLESAKGIAAATGAIEAHAAACPGCPQCVTGRTR